jgi:hypothetical protein
MTRWLTASVVLGATPLATGISIFLLWLLVRWDWLMFAGLLTIYGGMLCVGGGLLSLVTYWALARRQGATLNLTRRVMAVAFLQFLNFPVAFAAGGAAIHIATRYTVEVRNEGSSDVDRVELSGGGVQVVFETIPGGGSREEGFHFTQDGSLEFVLLHEGQEHRGVVEGYVTNGGGGHRTLVVHQDGEVSVQ